jgi:hypothetical protein
MAAEIILNFRRRYGRLSATVAAIGGLLDRDIQDQLAAMEHAVAHQDIVRLSALANQLLGTLDLLEAGGFSRRRGDAPAPSPSGPDASPSSTPT